MRANRLFLATVLAATAAAIPATSFASSGYVTDFKNTYPNSPARLQSCTLCHTNAPALNFYGGDFSANHAGTSQQAFKAVEPLDSDGDGYDNASEIASGSYPGDIGDVPPAAAAAATPVNGGTSTIGIPPGSTININIYNNGTSTPAAVPPGGAGTAAGLAGSTGTTTAAVCITCHSDGRSGATPPGHPDISGLESVMAANPGRNATDNSPICALCHSGRSGTIPGDHPDLTGSINGGRGDEDEHEEDDD